jgi:regulator of Ty1 transposition protein 103
MKFSNIITIFDQRLGIGGTAERIVSALHTVLSEQADEDADLEKCKTSMRRVGKMEKDVNSACIRGNICCRPGWSPAFLLP